MTAMLTPEEKRLKCIEDRLQGIENVISEAVSSGRNAIGIYNRQLMWEDTFNQMAKTLNNLKEDIKSLMTDTRYVELFTAEEIKNYYMATDLTVKEVKEKINEHFPDKKDLTIQTIGNYVQGNIPDVHIRSFLGKYLKNEANKKSLATKSEPTGNKRSVPVQGKV